MNKCKNCGLNPDETQSLEQQEWEADYIKDVGICSACDNEREQNEK
jgi:hypothetical protein